MQRCIVWINKPFYWKEDKAKIQGPKIGRAKPVDAQVLQVLFCDLGLSLVLFTINIMSIDKTGFRLFCTGNNIYVYETLTSSQKKEANIQLQAV